LTDSSTGTPRCPPVAVPAVADLSLVCTLRSLGKDGRDSNTASMITRASCTATQERSGQHQATGHHPRRRLP
jgi:hypothetical protein